MSPEDNNNNNQDTKTFMQRWKNLTIIMKSIYAAIVAIPTLIGVYFTIISLLSPEDVPIKFKDRISAIEYLDQTSINHILDSCAIYKKNGFNEFLNTFEKMECRTESKKNVISWFKKSNNKFNKKKYADILLERSEIFFNQYIQDIIVNDIQLDGVYNYIDLYAYVGKKRKRKAKNQLNYWNIQYKVQVEADTSGIYNRIEVFDENIKKSIKKLCTN